MPGVGRRYVTIDGVGAVGELIAAIATVATLFYLATQIRQSTGVARAASQQALLDTFAEMSAELYRDRDLAQLVGSGLMSFEALDDSDKTIFMLVLSRYVVNLEKGILLQSAGLIDQETFEGVAAALVASVRTPGGDQWWSTVATKMSSPLVVQYVDAKIAEGAIGSAAWNENFPFWARWGQGPDRSGDRRPTSGCS
jgi:hypothetical protein